MSDMSSSPNKDRVSISKKLYWLVPGTDSSLVNRIASVAIKLQKISVNQTKHGKFL